MADNNEWLQRVAFKLNELHLNGFDFQDVHRWIFDWDDKLTSKENLENVRDEDRALTTLKQAGVIHGISKDNFYREQQELQLATILATQRLATCVQKHQVYMYPKSQSGQFYGLDSCKCLRVYRLKK